MITRRRILAATAGFSALAAAEALDGKTIDWMEKVSDEHYQRSAG